MAPTRPLIKQQMEACSEWVNLPAYQTVCLEGTTSPQKREKLWHSSHVIFCTPQVAKNDLESGLVDGRSIVCVVVDEAHRATNDYYYTTVIHQLNKVSDHFRVLALSATPGSCIARVQTVRFSVFYVSKVSLLISPLLDLHNR